jgi:MFS family permease
MFGRPGAAIGVLNGTWAAAMLVAPIAAGMLLQSSGLRLPYLVLVVISAASGLVLLHRTSGGDHSARSRSASDLHAELSGGPDDSASADVSAAMAEPVFSADVLKGAATPR